MARVAQKLLFRDVVTQFVGRNCPIDFATEQFEVVSYQALIEAASQVGDVQTARVCEQIMREDQAMADRIVRSLPIVVAAQLAKQEFTLPRRVALPA
jgi:rubrerythrin